MESIIPATVKVPPTIAQTWKEPNRVVWNKLWWTKILNEYIYVQAEGRLVLKILQHTAVVGRDDTPRYYSRLQYWKVVNWSCCANLSHCVHIYMYDSVQKVCFTSISEARRGGYRGRWLGNWSLHLHWSVLLFFKKYCTKEDRRIPTIALVQYGRYITAHKVNEKVN